MGVNETMARMAEMKEIRHFIAKPDLEISTQTFEDYDTEWIRKEYGADERALIVKIDYDVKRIGNGIDEPTHYDHINHRVTECYWSDESDGISLDDETEKLLISMIQ